MMSHPAARLARDTFYVTVGFGVLAFQKLQVRRRELGRDLETRLAGSRDQLGRLVGRS